MSIGRFLIYALCDPRTNCVRYVGQSSIGIERPRRKHSRYCRNWEISLEKSGLEKEIVILEELNNSDELDDAERFWIASWRLMGAQLTNLTDGGGKGTRGWVPTQENRKNISRSKTGKRIPLLAAVARKTFTGRAKSPEQRAKMSEARRLWWVKKREEHHNAT